MHHILLFSRHSFITLPALIDKSGIAPVFYFFCEDSYLFIIADTWLFQEDLTSL